MKIKTLISNDTRGKIHELLTAAHLNRLIHGELAHADHFRDEKGRSPHEAHDALVKDISESDYQTAHSHAVQAAESIYNHINDHHPELLNPVYHIKVSWTSLKSDHEKLTSKKDEAHAGGADIMLSSHDKHTGMLHHAVGYSLKIADNRITLGQTGSTTTENLLGMKPGTLTKYDENYRKEVEDILKKYGHNAKFMSEAEKHAAFKASRDNITESKMADEIRNSSYKHVANKVKKIKKHLESLPETEQKNLLINFIAPKHAFPTYQVVTKPSKGTTTIKNENERVSFVIKKSGPLKFEQSSGMGNKLYIRNHEGKTLNVFEIRSKRPAGHSEVIVK
jgi:predicted transcriptional regulator